MAPETNRLTEEEVRNRLKLCTDPNVLEEVYTFGQMMLRETIANFRTIDTKAGSMAAFGGAVITLLVSSSGAWLSFANGWTCVIAILAGLTAFLSTFFSVRALALREMEWLGDREWLEGSCLAAVDKLKRYRILTIWGAMNSRKTAHAYKVRKLSYAQALLLIAVFLLLVMLFQIAWIRAFNQSLRLPGWKII